MSASIENKQNRFYYEHENSSGQNICIYDGAGPSVEELSSFSLSQNTQGIHRGGYDLAVGYNGDQQIILSLEVSGRSQSSINEDRDQSSSSGQYSETESLAVNSRNIISLATYNGEQFNRSFTRGDVPIENSGGGFRVRDQRSFGILYADPANEFFIIVTGRRNFQRSDSVSGFFRIFNSRSLSSATIQVFLKGVIVASRNIQRPQTSNDGFTNETGAVPQCNFSSNQETVTTDLTSSSISNDTNPIDPSEISVSPNPQVAPFMRRLHIIRGGQGEFQIPFFDPQLSANADGLGNVLFSLSYLELSSSTVRQYFNFISHQEIETVIGFSGEQNPRILNIGVI